MFLKRIEQLLLNIINSRNFMKYINYYNFLTYNKIFYLERVNIYKIIL